MRGMNKLSSDEINSDRLTFQPLTLDHWADFEQLFRPARRLRRLLVYVVAQQTLGA